jgi:hypothetical protein
MKPKKLLRQLCIALLALVLGVQNASARYIQADPAGTQGGLNQFVYAEGNALIKADPSGLCPMCLVPALPYIPELLIIGTTWWASQNTNLTYSRPKNPPTIGPPNGWIQGPRRGRQYGPDGAPQCDYDKPHQGNNQDHVHEWPGGEREEPGRPYSPWPRQDATGRFWQ